MQNPDRVDLPVGIFYATAADKINNCEKDAMQPLSKAEKNNKVAVIGIGNVLMGDDAVGPYTIKMINACYNERPEVVVWEVGTPAGELPGLLAPFDRAIIVDSVQSSAAPGGVVRFELRELLATNPNCKGTPHDPGLVEALMQLEFMGEGPRELILMGMVPKNLAMTVGLSQPVQEALPALVDAIIAELARLGFGLDRKPIPSKPDIWWENTL